jgi:hypothetical protein
MQAVVIPIPGSTIVQMRASVSASVQGILLTGGLDTDSGEILLTENIGVIFDILKIFETDEWAHTCTI